MIQFMPRLESELWSRKCQRTFDSIRSLAEFVSDKCTLFCNYAGIDLIFTPADVELHITTSHSGLIDVVLSGHIVGYCWE